MKAKIKYSMCCLLLLGYCISNSLYGQTSGNVEYRSDESLFTLRGSVQEADSYQPISRINVEIAGGDFTTTDALGEFRIRARVGDELVITNPGFETVRYLIKNKQRILLQVIPFENEDVEKPEEVVFEEKIDLAEPVYERNRDNKASDKRGRKVKFLDIARNTYRENLSSSIEQVTRSLEQAKTDDERGEAFALLGTIYTYWKQYDLAITNYKLALEKQEIEDWQMGLAKAYFLNNNYEESIAEYRSLKSRVQTGAERLLILEQLGDAQKAIGLYDEAIANYEEAKELLKEIGIEGGSQLDIKIGEVYDAKGAFQEADVFYNYALNESENESDIDAARTKLKVADQFNKKQSYGREIQLRNEALNTIGTLGDSIVISNDNVLTAQKQNYKIANALIGQQRLDEAIPYFEKSISEAAASNDLIVEKDATRKLSEIYRDNGDFDKALASYERYAALVDEDYTRKEQEIGRAEQRAKVISESQNRILSLEKDRTLNENRYQLAFQERELNVERDKRQRIIITALASVILLLLLTVILGYRGYKQQRYTNNMLALRGLRSQMNPHFIFNALNSVNSFIATSDERRANAYLSDFSKLMRSVLENSEENFIPLSSEIELIEKYTMLEHFRFQDKFDYELRIDDDLKVDDFQIPPMLLQPYVENAVWHGLRYKEDKGRLDIYFGKKDANTAVVVITDDGVGRTKSKALKTNNQKKQQSKGMSNIKKRIAILNKMYNDRVAVQVEDLNSNGEGTRVTLLLKK